MSKLEIQRKIINHSIHDLVNARSGINAGIKVMLMKLKKMN